ncbi:MAG: polysaccharide biosynthesis tyrosine autokinase [Clostridia bacterium]|nr:polysaccharide biosynthesis tyrosine autokinase [Clostridia bacterium]
MANPIGIKPKKKTETVKNDAATELLGEKLHFDGIEAFNLLRTNLSFSFSDEKKCHIIGVTSPVPGTGKSLISTNMAYSIAKAGRKVLLIDGDLRLPTVAAKMKIAGKPGLSNILVSPLDPMSYVQHYNGTLDVLVAGDIPPKPSELLGSDRMGNVLDELSEFYEYIIFDLTPVTVVPDTLAVAKYLDGVVIVLRRDHDEKRAFDDTLRQLELAKARIIGIVFNSGSGYRSAYGKIYKKTYGYRKSNKKSSDNYRYGAKPTMKENGGAVKSVKPVKPENTEKNNGV